MTCTVRFIGSGDAFGSGGRLQTCILVDAPGVRLALDFGATSLVGLRREGVDPNSIDAIFLTHFHGDHCGGVPFLFLDAMLDAKRARPLTIAGPQGVEGCIDRMREALFPGSGVMRPTFPLSFVELPLDAPSALLGLTATATRARHTRETNPTALRLEIGGRSIAYTGDGECTPALCDLVAGVDLLIAESYFYSKSIRWHLNYPDIARLRAKRIVLTHMHRDMLEHRHEVTETCAYDGMALEV